MNRARYDTKPPDPAAVRAAREAAGLTLAQAGAIVHVGPEVWRTWESPRDSTRHRQMSAAHWELYQRKAPKHNMTELELRAWTQGSDRVHTELPELPAPRTRKKK